MIVFTIFECIFFFITIIASPFIAIVDYVVHGELTEDYVMKVCDLLGNITDKLKPE